jgi:acylphosphatase
MTEGAALRAEVHGQVQDAGFAGAVLSLAETLGLSGWAREDPDGVVRVHAEGDPGSVEELRGFLATGPAGAQVERVAEQPAKVEGHEQFAIRGVPAGAFVVREHARGFDLSLEVGEDIVSWTIRKEPSMNPAERRMAIATPPDELSADATVWDSGPYEQGGRVAWPEAIERGHAVFVLHGERLRGGFALQRTRDRQWLFVKRRDEHARPPLA